MNPFVYQKLKHIRTQSPPVYTNYASYKPFLQIEFSKKCVYCRTPDSMRGTDVFGADHYRPKKYFPHLATVYENLFYCCNACNSRKSSHWPGKGKSSQYFIPNPCDHEMFRHLRFKGDIVDARTPEGKFTRDLLDLNAPDIVDFRNAILVAIDTTTARLKELGQLIQSAQEKQAKGMLSPEKVAEATLKINTEISRAKKALLKLSGELSV